MDKSQEIRLEESIRRLEREKQSYKKFLRGQPIGGIEVEIIKELNRKPLQGEREIYITSGKSKRKVLGRLMDAEYIKRNKKKKYYLTEDGYRKVRSAEIGIARTVRNLEKKKRKEMRETVKKWKTSLPELKQRKEKIVNEMKKIHSSVDPETRKAVANNKYIWKGHSEWIDIKDDQGVKKIKLVEAKRKGSNKLSNKIYRREGAIKRIEDKLKGKKMKPIIGELPIEKELKVLREREYERLKKN